MPSLGTKSLERLATCDERLQRLFASVVTEIDCTVLCGHRGQAEQEEAFASGHSRAHWPDSPHNSDPSRAADVAPYPIDWNDTDAFHALAEVAKRHAQHLGISIRWGGDFKSLRDLPHYELTD